MPKAKKKKKISKKTHSKVKKGASKAKKAPKEGKSKDLPENIETLGYCGINCKACREKSKRIANLSTELNDLIKDMPFEEFAKDMPIFKGYEGFLAILKFFPSLSGFQTYYRQDPDPCGKFTCKIRICVKEKDYITCADCGDYKTCDILGWLKPDHPTLIEELNELKERGYKEILQEIGPLE